VSVMLRAGVPLMLIPLNLEQALVARRAALLNAAVVADANDAETFRVGLRGLLIEEKLSKAAQRFAKQYRDHDPQAALAEAVAVVTGP